MKILSVDDNNENLYLLESMLRTSGYEVDSAHNGVEALNKLEHEPVDLIVSDILMPQMDGFELCREVKKREELRRIPFVFYTATYTDPKDEALALRLGASRFITKPVEPEQFLSSIAEVLQDFEAGQLPAAPPSPDKEAVLLKAYNQRLVDKIERKVEQLEETAHQLQEEVAERRRAEGQVRQLNAELEQRVQERTAELRAANAQLESFVSAVAHDLRAPLRSIDGFGHMLESAYGEKLDSQGRRFLEGLRVATQRMNQFVQACLGLAQVTHCALQREPVNLSEEAQAIEADLRREAPARDVEFVIAPNLVAEGDPTLLHSVLQNLLGNAWKFTSRTPHARIELGRDPPHGAYFVRDNGIGFRMDLAGKLFRPLERLPSAAGFPGTGIGLATVEQIIRRHGGRIWAEAALGQGATFHFTLA
jgi:signal transduction histidine kinase